MPKRPTVGLAVLMAAVAVASTARAEDLKELLSQKVQPVYERGLGKDMVKARLASFEAECIALLDQWKQPEEQGMIYTMLARTYAQKGQILAEKTAMYAAKAVQYPGDPFERSLVYAYWGDAVRGSRGAVQGEALAAVRRETVVPYLLGLKDLQALNLPETAPAVPGEPVFARGPKDSEAYRSAEAEIAAGKLAKFQADMVRRRDVLRESVVYMYSKMPFATEELAQLANDILQDPRAVEQLMSLVKSGVQKRVEKLAGDPLAELPPDLEKQPGPSPQSAVPSSPPAPAAAASEQPPPVAVASKSVPVAWIVAGAGGLLLLAGLLLRRRVRRG